MSLDAAGFLLILVAMMALFLSQKLPSDLTALTGLLVCGVLEYLTPAEVFSGFSSPAVVTMISMFFIGAALASTGVTEKLARYLVKQVGHNRTLLVAAIVLMGMFFAALMQNVAAALILLPAVIIMAQETETPPSKLLMPLAFGVIFGGTLTSVGSNVNILATDLMAGAGLGRPKFFSFTPYSGCTAFVGFIFLITWAQKALPNRGLRNKNFKNSRADLAQVYQLSERLFSLKVPRDSILCGLSLAQARFHTIFEAAVVSINRDGQRLLSPGSSEILRAGDVLVVQGRKARVQALLRFCGVQVETVTAFQTTEVAALKAVLLKKAPDSWLGQSLSALNIRTQHKVRLVSIIRENKKFCPTSTESLAKGDRLYFVGAANDLEKFCAHVEVEYESVDLESSLSGHLYLARLPEATDLSGMSLEQSKLAEVLGLNVLMINRSGQPICIPDFDEVLQGNDRLLLIGAEDGVSRLGMLGTLEIEELYDEPFLVSSDVSVGEVLLSPHSKVFGRTLVEIAFRERYGLQILAIFRAGRPIRTQLAQTKLEFGDALLVHGPRQQFAILKDDPDYIILNDSGSEPFKSKQAAFAITAIIMVTLLSALHILPTHLAAAVGAVFVLLSRAIKLELVYAQINWKIVFLVGSLIPLGQAMQHSGAAAVVSQVILTALGHQNELVVVIAITIFASLLSQMLDSTVAVVLLSPIVLQIARTTGYDARTLIVGMTLAASIAFLTPFSHKVNLLVMGPGGYKPKDYFKVGLPLTIITLLVLWAALFLRIS